MALQGAELLLIRLGLLEGQALRRIGHEGLVMLDYLPAAAAEDVHNLVYVAVVGFPGHFAHTWAATFADVKLQAGPELAAQDGVGGDFERTGAKLIDLVKKVHQIARMHHAAVRAEVTVALSLLYAAGDEHAGELLPCNANPGIGFGVLQEDVVLGLVLLDEVVFQQERIGLAVHHRELRIGYLAHQNARFGIEPLRRHKVLRHPLVQILRLPHINHLPLGVIIPVYARGMRKQRYLFADGHSVHKDTHFLYFLPRIFTFAP